MGRWWRYKWITFHPSLTVQIAGLPDRHEPDDGEINYPWLFRLFDEVGYQGWIGCEYKPRGLTEEGLGWFDAWR
ncbi:hypothetical protein EC2875150_3104 [Escherichia coli 2875150]|nr:hypothetical protein EC2875150_3104 [Escherichia coli 2875150]